MNAHDGTQERTAHRLSGPVRAGLRFDRNPLRRATDRIETTVLTALVVAFLAVAPFAAQAAGAWVHGWVQSTQMAQERSLHRVPARVTAVTVPSGAPGAPWLAQVRWRALDGQQMTGVVTAGSGTVAGGTVPVWTDRSGQQGAPPASSAQLASLANSARVLGVLALAGALTLAGTLARRALDRRRMAAWDAAWRAAGPRWTTAPEPAEEGGGGLLAAVPVVIQCIADAVVKSAAGPTVTSRPR